MVTYEDLDSMWQTCHRLAQRTTELEARVAELERLIAQRPIAVPVLQFPIRPLTPSTGPVFEEGKQ